MGGWLLGGWAYERAATQRRVGARTRVSRGRCDRPAELLSSACEEKDGASVSNVRRNCVWGRVWWWLWRCVVEKALVSPNGTGAYIEKALLHQEARAVGGHGVSHGGGCHAHAACGAAAAAAATAAVHRHGGFTSGGVA